MRTLLVLVLTTLCLSILGQDSTLPTTVQTIMEVGQIFPGTIILSESKQRMHYLSIKNKQKKYLFIRISTTNTARTSIGIYSNKTRELIYSCEDNIYDSCFVKSEILKPFEIYVILIVSNQDLQYNLYTYWGDLEHLKPNQEVKFMFDKQNPTQLFHLEFEGYKYQQIRIMLSPEAAKNQGDYLKIYANLGFLAEPTIEKHDFESSRIWGDSEAIFLSKQDVKGQSGIGIYIVGNTDTVYVLQCEFMETKSHELKINSTISEYLPKGESTYYEMSFNQNVNIDSFMIKFAVFTGELEVGVFYDRQFKRAYQKLPYQYMSDMQFNFQRSDFQKNTKQIFIQVRCPDSPATYQISAQGRNKQIAFQLQEGVFEFSALNEAGEAMYFYSNIFDSGEFEQQKTYKFDVSVIKIYGNVQFQFYICNSNDNEEQCKNVNDKKFSENSKKITPVGIEEIGSKIINTLEFNSSEYKTLNPVEKKLMVIVLAINQRKGESSAYAVEYVQANKIRLLRENRAFEDKVRTQQKKYYKYTNNNPNVSQILIHVNEISGLTKVRAKRSDITSQGGNEMFQDKNLPDTIIIKDKLTQPIYLEVWGLVTSIYTISVSASHAGHAISNSLVMAEDIQYNLKLMAYQTVNVQLHPIEADVSFQFYSEGGSVNVCQVDLQSKCLGDMYSGSHGEMRIDASKTREVRLKVSNDVKGNNQDKKELENTKDSLSKRLLKNVKVTLMYHANTLNHCDERRLNKVYSQNVKSGACFKFHLPLVSDIEIMSSRSDLGKTSQFYFLCSKKVTPLETNGRLTIKAETIKQHCKELPHDMNLMMVLSDNSHKIKEQIKMDYSVEYGKDIITLEDGVAYVSRGYNNEEQAAIRTFFYEIVDENRDVNIVLYNKRGIQKFYGVIVNKTERYNRAVTEASAKFNSKKSNYYTNPFIKISKSDIESANCGRTCILILSIYSQEKVGAEIEWAIEVTQNHIYLKQDETKKEFLAKGSSQFYQYETRNKKGSLIFKVSDNNKKCARSIMSKTPFPTGSNYLVKENQGTIIYENTGKNTLYFAVEAIQDCPYSVSISEGTANITKLSHGQFYDVKLQEGEQKWFYTRHTSNISFKIISLKMYGEIDIFAKKAELSNEVLESIEKKIINASSFPFKNTYMNTLAIETQAKGYCFNCYYLICVRARKPTETSIFIGSQNSKIAMVDDKILFDDIEKVNATTFATFHRIQPGKLQVKVHTGKINFEMTYQKQKYSKVFSQNVKVYHENYTFQREEGSLMFSPIQIRVTAIEVPALYSFELTPNVDKSDMLHKINPGEHTYIFLSKGKEECLTGQITSKQHEVFISVDPSGKYSLENLDLNVSVNGVKTQKYKKQLVGNILSITFISEQTFFQKVQNFSICMLTKSSEDLVSIFAFENQNVNLIHPDTQVLVRNQSKFVLYPGEDIILDLFECKGNAQIFYGNDLNTLYEKQSHKLDVIGIPGQNHAIKIVQYSTLYVSVKAEMATLLWMGFDPDEERGIGYFKYRIGSLDYVSKFKTLEFNIGGIYKANSTQTTVKNIKYTLFISNSKQLLQSAVMCQQSPKNNLVYTSINTDKVGSNSSHILSIYIDKKRITDAFKEGQTLFFNVVADMTLISPSRTDEDEHEHYRFIYFEQVVPAEVFRQNKVETFNFSLLIVFAIVSILGCVLLSCIFVRYIVPALARLKNRMLVEEKEDPKDQSIPIPPSSDRNHVPVGPVTEEEVK